MPDREYWVTILNKHLEASAPGDLLTIGKTVAVRLRPGNSTTATFGEGATFHVDDPAELTVDGENVRKTPPLNARWSDITSITFSYNGRTAKI